MFKRILLPVDLSDEGSFKRALPVALQLAKDYGATLHVMTVVPDYGLSIVGQFFPKTHEKEMMALALEKLHEFTKKHLPARTKCQHIVAHGTVYQEILNVTREIEADLVVLASHRPGLEDYLLGPNAARVVRHAHCSVLVVRD